MTYFEAVGGCGIMEHSGEKVFPIYNVLSAIGEVSGASVRLFSSNNQSKAAGMLIQNTTRSRAICANLTNYILKISVRGLARELHLMPDTGFDRELLPYEVIIVDGKA